VPHRRVRALVRHGEVVLSGEVDWKFERDAAAAAVQSLSGVKRVVNEITLRPHERPSNLKQRVEQALARSAEIDATAITIDLIGGRIVLRGAARTWAERDEAERLAWAAPGVIAVENELVVQLPEQVPAPAAS
jgi:osmotically-inducible protein OsmY